MKFVCQLKIKNDPLNHHSAEVVWCGVLPGTWSVFRPCCISSERPESSERTAGPASSCCRFPLTESDSAASASPRLCCTPEDRQDVQGQRHSLSHLLFHLLLVSVVTRAWKEDTEKTPRRPSMLLEGRLVTARRLLGFGSSLPCRLDR